MLKKVKARWDKLSKAEKILMFPAGIVYFLSCAVVLTVFYVIRSDWNNSDRNYVNFQLVLIIVMLIIFPIICHFVKRKHSIVVVQILFIVSIFCIPDSKYYFLVLIGGCFMDIVEWLT